MYTLSYENIITTQKPLQSWRWQKKKKREANAAGFVSKTWWGHLDIFGGPKFEEAAVRWVHTFNTGEQSRTVTRRE